MLLGCVSRQAIALGLVLDGFWGRRSGSWKNLESENLRTNCFKGYSIVANSYYPMVIEKLIEECPIFNNHPPIGVWNWEFGIPRFCWMMQVMTPKWLVTGMIKNHFDNGIQMLLVNTIQVLRVYQQLNSSFIVTICLFNIAMENHHAINRWTIYFYGPWLNHGELLVITRG